MRSPLKHRTQKVPLVVFISTLSAAWMGVPLAAEKSPEGPPVDGPHTFHYADTTAIAVPILSQPANYELPMRDGFTQMHAGAICDRVVPGRIDVSLEWSSTRAGVEAYRVDITELGDGFEKGRFRTSGERPTSVKELPFEDASAGVYYYWRVLTKTVDGWVVGGSGRFDAPTCPVDESEEERE